MPLGMQVGLGPGDFVLDGDPAIRLPQQKISAHVYCGQTARCIKMALGMQVRLNLGDFALDGDSVPSPKGGGAPSPIFGRFLLCPNSWMHQDAT